MFFHPPPGRVGCEVRAAGEGNEQLERGIRVLRSILRAHPLCGLKFRREHPIGSSIAALPEASFLGFDPPTGRVNPMSFLVVNEDKRAMPMKLDCPLS
jgi:hypothetical protein